VAAGARNAGKPRGYPYLPPPSERERGESPLATFDLSVNQPTNPVADLSADDLSALVALAKQVMAAQRAAEARTVRELAEPVSGSSAGG
jgi:hypothetical protein